jgi:hypothetical protein
MNEDSFTPSHRPPPLFRRPRILAVHAVQPETYMHGRSSVMTCEQVINYIGRRRNQSHPSHSNPAGSIHSKFPNDKSCKYVDPFRSRSRIRGAHFKFQARLLHLIVREMRGSSAMGGEIALQ